MRSIFYLFIAFFLTITFFVSCKKMDDSYKQFVVPGGIIYLGKATSPFASAGQNRIKISWLRGVDPTVAKARIFWNNYADSIEVDIPSTGDTISVIIDGLPEKSYNFYIKTYDAKGHVSVPVEVLSTVYGDNYQAGLLSRPIVSLLLGSSGEVRIVWGGADITNGAMATEIKYTDTTGVTKTRRFSIKEVSSIIKDRMPGSAFQYRTLFIPDSLSIDTFYTSYDLVDHFSFDKSDWEVIDFSSKKGKSKNQPSNILDGDPKTRWSSSTSAPDHLPQFVTVDMKSERVVTSFEIFRQTGNSIAIDTFQLFVSKDNNDWISVGVFAFDRFIDDGQLYEIPSHPKARYWKFVGISGPRDYLRIGEINIYGY